MTIIKTVSTTPMIVAALLGFCSNTTFAQELPPAAIYVRESRTSGAANYTYRVKNDSRNSLTAVMIGYDYLRGFPELKGVPKGWKADSPAPLASIKSPPGWKPEVRPTEENDSLVIVWSVTDPAYAIQPSRVMSGFGVTLDSPDPTYKTGHWTLSVVGDSSPYSWTLTPETVCPTARLSVTMKPNVMWSPDHTMEKIQAVVSAADDFDGVPEITLQSITSNEVLVAGDVSANFNTDQRQFQLRSERKGANRGGHVETVSYSARNACGDTVVAKDTVMVPHDKR